MKMPARNLIVILIALMLLATMIILLNINTSKMPAPKKEAPKEEVGPAEQLQQLQLPPKGERPEEMVKEEKELPEADVKEIPFDDIIKENKKPVKLPEETEVGPEPATKKYHTEPTPEELRRIKQRGLVIY